MEPQEPRAPRPLPPREACPDHPDCHADPAEIGHVCSYGPICGTCVVYRVLEVERGLLRGSCRLRPDRGEFPCTAPICDAYVPRTGAPDRHGRATVGPAVVQLATAVARQAARPPVRGTGRSSRSTSAAPPATVRPVIPDGPLGEFEMTREELKALIREAMDEERGGGAAALAPKWEGGTCVLKPADAALQAKELPLDALFHKVVMIRDRLRVLEQKLNAHPKLSDAEKVELQGYLTACAGSLTTFNVLFRDREDGFQGAGGK